MLPFLHRPRERALRHEIPGLYAWVSWSRRSGLRLHGHHVMRGDASPFGRDVEYEYLVLLTDAEQRRLADLLGVRHPRGLVDALAGRGTEVVAHGERQWLRRLLGPDATELQVSMRNL